MLELAKQIENAINTGEPIYDDTGHHMLINELVNVMLDFPEKPKGFRVEIKKPELYKKVILVSGGADSTIMWELNKVESSKLGIYVSLGHSYVQKEVDALEKMGIDYKFISHPLQFDLFWKHIIPTRNYVLLSIAEEYTEHEGEIWLGAVEGESAPDKGDKSELFFRLFEDLVWRTKRKRVTIRTLKDKTKNDWLKWYIETTGNMNILDTITCFDGTKEKPCGKCQACVRKWISLKYCSVSQDVINNMFEVNPFEGGKEFIEKYSIAMQEALDKKDFTHYSENRCIQDLNIIRNERLNADSNTG